VRFTAFGLLVLALLLGQPAPSSAQATSPPPADVSDQQLSQHYEELLTWLAAFREWEEWIVKWGNRIAYNAAGGVIKDRPARPDPPDWLWQECATLIAADGAYGEACEILTRWDELPHLILTRKSVGGITAPTDVVQKSSFLQRVHLTGGWVPAQLPAPKIYLAVGMSVGVVELGRITLPAVGVGIMAIADGDGGYDWKPATVVGMGYRLTSFPFPWISREASLHVNVARITIHGVRNLPIGVDPSQNFIGFSLTFKKAR
jgi:hypothetical protein